MARRRSSRRSGHRRASRSSAGCAVVAGLLALPLLISIAPALLILAGLVLIVWLAPSLIAKIRSAPAPLPPPLPAPPPSPPTSASAGMETDLRRLTREGATLVKQMERGGKWQTQAARLESARRTTAKLQKLLDTIPGIGGTSSIVAERSRAALASLDQAAGDALRLLWTDLTSRYTGELSRLEASPSAANNARSADRLLLELRDLYARLPELKALHDHFAPRLGTQLYAARGSQALKSTLTAARSLERDGQWREALNLYLDHLHALRTDAVDDREQQEQFTALEDAVRSLVRNCYLSASPDSRRASTSSPRPQGA